MRSRWRRGGCSSSACTSSCSATDCARPRPRARRRSSWGCSRTTARAASRPLKRHRHGPKLTWSLKDPSAAPLYPRDGFRCRYQVTTTCAHNCKSLFSWKIRALTTSRFARGNITMPSVSFWCGEFSALPQFSQAESDVSTFDESAELHSYLS
eukprot:433467-Pleurochrysis_carterae.AAC.2